MLIEIVPAPRNEEWWEGFDWGVVDPARHQASCRFVTAPGSPDVSLCDCGAYTTVRTIHEAKMEKKWLCAYCGIPTETGPWVANDGTGWMPNCWHEDCEYLAQRDALKQRLAKERWQERTE